MSHLDRFYSSEENQRKYGFKYSKDSNGIVSIFYDGDIDVLMDAAYASLGYEQVESPSQCDSSDSMPELLLEYSHATGIILKGPDVEVTVDVDGAGDYPNFFFRFTENGREVTIRFNMLVPEIYPGNESLPYHLPSSSLSAVNELFRYKCDELVEKWNELRPDKPMKLKMLPNYRAINRIY